MINKTCFEFPEPWNTVMGLWFPGEKVVYRGKDLMNDLGDLSWFQLYLYGITGRLFDEKEGALLEGIWVLCTSYPDPRLWNNRVAALAGSARATGSLGTAAAVAISEAGIYGQGPGIGSIDFLIRTKAKLEAGDKLEAVIAHELKTNRVIPGYGRPIIMDDERIKPLMALATKLGFNEGYYVKLAFTIERILIAGRWRMKMNAAGLIAALAADLGLTPREHYLYTIFCFAAGIVPCYLEGTMKPEGAFLPLPCSTISYRGKEKRAWKNEQSHYTK